MIVRPATRALGKGLRLPFRANVAPGVLSVSGAVFGVNTSSATGSTTSTSVTPTTSDAIVFLAFRKVVTGAYTGSPVLTVGGLTAVQLDVADQAGTVGNVLHYVYVVRGLTAGSPITAIWAGNGSQSVGKMIAAIVSLSNWQGNIGSHVASVSHPASTVDAVASAITPDSNGSLILGAAFGTDKTVSPFTAAGFSVVASGTCSSSPPSSGMTVFSKPGTVATQTLTPVAAAAWTDYGSALVEVY